MRVIGLFFPIPAPLDTFIVTFLLVLLLMRLFSALLPFFRPNMRFQLYLAFTVAIFGAMWEQFRTFVREAFYPVMLSVLPVPVILLDILMSVVGALLLYYIIVKLVL